MSSSAGAVELADYVFDLSSSFVADAAAFGSRFEGLINECMCDAASLRNVVEYMSGIAREAVVSGKIVSYPNIVIVAKVRGGGWVCIWPPCICRAIEELVETPSLARGIALTIVPVRGEFDLGKPDDLLRLRGLASIICYSGSGKRETVELFVRFYLIERASRDGEFKAKVVNWLDKIRARAPYGLVPEIMSHIHRLGINVDETTIREALLNVRYRWYRDILEKLGYKAEETQQEGSVEVKCPDIKAVDLLLKELGFENISEASVYVGVLCMLSENKLRALLKLVREDPKVKEGLKGILARGVSADDLRGFIDDHLAKAEASEDETEEGEAEEVPEVEGGKEEVGETVGEKEGMETAGVGRVEERGVVAARSEVGGVGEGNADAAAKSIGVKPHLTKIKYECLGDRAYESLPCMAIRSIDEYVRRRDPGELLRASALLLSEALGNMGPAGLRANIPELRDALTKLLTLLRVPNVGMVVNVLLYGTKFMELLGRALGGDVDAALEVLGIMLGGRANLTEVVRGLSKLGEHDLARLSKLLGDGAVVRELVNYADVVKGVLDALGGRADGYEVIDDLASRLDLDRLGLANKLASEVMSSKDLCQVCQSMCKGEP
jgi:hypothetical protein